MVLKGTTMKSRSKRLAIGLLALTGMATAPALAQPNTKVSTAAQRKEVSITVYNQNFGLVREVRKLNLGTGKTALEFQDVAAQIQPETVHIKASGRAAAFNVLEQNYRYDLLTPQTLLEKFVGEKVRVYRYNQRTGKEQGFDAKLLSNAGGSQVIQLGNEITFGFGGRMAFPKVPDNLIAKPTLVWLLDSKAAAPEVEVTYLTQGMTWKADYVVVLDAKDEKGDLTGWVTLTNNSGTGYEDARLKLVAGDVNRVSRPGGTISLSSAKRAAAQAPAFQEEGFFEYHLYTLQRPTTVRDKEQKQVTLLEAENVGFDKKLIFYGQQYWYRGRHGQVMSNQKVGVYLDVKNSKNNGLGIPLPKGIVRVYKADKSGAKQFVGEDSIDHTPKDEKIRIKMGEAFDVVGERKQTNWRTLGSCRSESSWEIELRNHKDTATRVEIYEPVGGEWNIVQSSHPHDKKDSRTFTFDVPVPANGKTKVTYTVQVRWC